MAETTLKNPSSPAKGGGHGTSGMAWVSCMVRPESVDAVVSALNQLEVVGGMTVTDVRGFGRQKGQVEHYRGGEYTIRFIPKVRVEVAVLSEYADDVVAAIGKAAKTGKVGDGKVFVSELSKVLRFRTGEQGTSAL